MAFYSRKVLFTAEDEKIGIVVFQMPINKINQILTGNSSWKQDGLGETGEAFIVGDDYKLRSISRPLMEAREAHFQRLRQSKYSVAIFSRCEKCKRIY